MEQLRRLLGHKVVITTQRYIDVYGDQWEQGRRKLENKNSNSVEAALSRFVSHSYLKPEPTPNPIAQMINEIESTGGRTRTDTPQGALDFESSASTNFATPADRVEIHRDGSAVKRLPYRPGEDPFCGGETMGLV